MRKTLIGALVFTLLSGCVTWQPEADLGNAADGEPWSRVRVTRGDGTRLVLGQAVVRADSIVGFEEIPGFEEAVRGGVPLSDVQTLEVRRTNGLLVVGIVFAALVIVYQRGSTSVLEAS